MAATAFRLRAYKHCRHVGLARRLAGLTAASALAVGRISIDSAIKTVNIMQESTVEVAEDGIEFAITILVLYKCDLYSVHRHGAHMGCFMDAERGMVWYSRV